MCAYFLYLCSSYVEIPVIVYSYVTYVLLLKLFIVTNNKMNYFVVIAIFVK